MTFHRAAFAVLSMLLSTQAAATWFEARSNHFVVYSEGSEKSTRLFASKLERFDHGLRKLHDIPNQEADRANPLTVYVVPDVSAVQKLCVANNASQKAGCKDIAGFYDGRVQGSVAFMPRSAGDGGKGSMSPQIVLFHEYSHHMMLANYGAAFPAWFVEGFAEFNSTANFSKDGTVGFGLPALHRAYGLLAGSPLPAEVLMAGTTYGLTGEKREALYGRGWLLTHYLTFEPTRAGQLGKYLDAINKGVSSVDAARANFGDLKQLDKQLDAYLRRPQLFYRAVAVPEIPDDDIRLRRLTPGEEAMMPIKLRSDRGVDPQSAAAVAVAVAARIAAQPFPNDPGAQLVLAEAEYDAGYDDLADLAADRVLAVKPDDYGALLYKGQIAMRRARLAKVTDQASWKKVRSWFIRANRIENNAAEALWLFYRSFQAEDVKPTDNAVAGLKRAFELVPQDKFMRFVLARQYLIDDKFAEARTILAPLAFDPHAKPDNAAAAMVALIDKGDRQAIMAGLRGKAVDKQEPAD